MSDWISWQDYCPYCGEPIELLLDTGFADPDAALVYSEDCQVCCRPIVVTLGIDDQGNYDCQLQMESDS